jgi:hypothetical protein
MASSNSAAWQLRSFIMATFTYNIDDNKLASGKQFNAVCSHYTNLLATKLNLTSQDRYVLFNRMRGAVGHYFGEVLNSKMTHGDVQLAFQATVVPSDILITIKIPSDAPKAQPKVVAVVEAPKKGRGRPKGSKNKAKETTKSPETLEQRVDSLESKMDKILEILTAK